MRFPDILKAKHAGWFCFVSTSGHLLGDGLKRNVRQGKARVAEHKTAEEAEMDTTRHLQQWVEVGHRGKPPRNPARHARPPRRSMARESRIVLLPTRSRTASICFRSAMRSDSSDPSISTRRAPSASNFWKRSWLRAVAMTCAPAFTAMFRAACPNDDIAPRITKVWPSASSRLRNRQVQAVA